MADVINKKARKAADHFLQADNSVSHLAVFGSLNLDTGGGNM